MKKPYINKILEKQKKNNSKCLSKNKKSKNKTIGILLVNLGTPQELTTSSIRTYLREFLSDQRVIEVNKLLWQLILNCFILPFRPKKILKNYAQIWNYKENESPLLTYTKSQSLKLQQEMSKIVDGVIVEYAMRYGQPSIDNKIHKLKESGCKHILVIPLYPQYSATTTATVIDCVNKSISKMRRQPNIRIAQHYMDDNIYIKSLQNSIEQHLKTVDFKIENIITSYHGIPLSYYKKGDPYPCHCKLTTRLLSEKMKKSGYKFTTTFQSLFGKQEWVKPYTSDTLKQMAKSGIENIAIIAPGFASDCIETLEEIEQELKDDFIKAGGKNFTYIPCLNDTEQSINLLKHIAIKDLSGWIELNKQ